LLGHATLDPVERVQRILELVFLEVDSGKPESRFVANALLDVPLEHRRDGTAGAVVHSIVELEIPDGEFGVLYVVLERVELGLVQPIVLRELRVQTLQRLEVVALIRLVKRLPEIEVAQRVVRSPGPDSGRQTQSRNKGEPASHDLPVL
jgi:hypothetical protein